jgi:hypothetical protein
MDSDLENLSYHRFKIPITNFGDTELENLPLLNDYFTHVIIFTINEKHNLTSFIHITIFH